MKNLFRFTLLMLVVVFGIDSSHAQWVQTGSMSLDAGFSSTSATALVVTHTASGDTDLFAGASTGLNNGMFQSSNGGTSWSQKYYFGATAPGLINTFGVSDTNIFAGTAAGIYLSTDNLNSWKLRDTGLAPTTPNITAFAFSGTNIFAGVSPGSGIINVPPYLVTLPGGVYHSTNNGATWSVADSGLTNSITTDISALATIGTTIFAGTSDQSGIFRSTNNGTTWTSASKGLLTVGDSTQFVEVNAFSVIGTKLFAGTSQGVFLSTDNGANWSQASTGIQLDDFSQYPAVLSLASAGANLYAGLNASAPGGVYLSTDSGASWTWTDSGKVGLHITSLLVSGNYIYAVSEIGVWKRLLNGTGTTAVTTKSNEVVNTFALSQNYPNPFNPSTVIQFTVPSNGRAVLKVFNILGQEVATLFDGVAAAGEYHQETFDASRLASGIYFSRLEFDGKMQMKKMLLLK